MGCLTRSAPARPCPWLYACAYVTDVAGFASKRRRLCPRGVTDADPASADRGCVFDGSAPFSGTTLRLCTPGCRAAGNEPPPPAGTRPVLRVPPARCAKPKETQLGTPPSAPTVRDPGSRYASARTRPRRSPGSKPHTPSPGGPRYTSARMRPSGSSLHRGPHVTALRAERARYRPSPRLGSHASPERIVLRPAPLGLALAAPPHTRPRPICHH